MKLTRASSYAIQAVLYMAKEENGTPIASHHIAKAKGIPERFLLKVLKPLVSARILVSLRGPNGGYRLARPANKITVLDILEAVEGPIRGQVLLHMGESRDPLDQKLETLCNEVADMSRRRLQKVAVPDLMKK